jgi:mannose-6-phosphate isomerase-like protein (cupin superfamily)
MTGTGAPYAVDIEQATLANDTYRTTLWTGKHLQLTVMSIPPGDDIGLVPAGTCHNVTNIGDDDVRVYVLYGPPDHLPGTIHTTHEDARRDPSEA